MKTAVVLFNLGGPLQEADIKPFLFNFFMDKNIIAAPQPFRYFIAKYISVKRGGGAAREAYAQLGFKSPLLENTQAQATALQTALSGLYPGDEIKVFTSMRYWKPFAKDVVQELNAFLPDRLILLPLYPQYSTTTTKSSFENFWSEVQADDGPLHGRWEDETKIYEQTCYPLLDGFIKASADLVKRELQKAPAGARVLFSAHGLPKKVVAAGDPYQYQCEKTAEAIAEACGLEKESWRICYQSRVGPLEWIGPSIEEELRNAAEDKTPVVVYPHAFVSEHVETLVELDIEYKNLAKEIGIPYYGRAQTVGVHPDFIEGLCTLVASALGEEKQPQICKASFSACGCLKKAA